MQQSPTPNVPVQLLLQWVPDASYSLVWQPGSTYQYNQPKHEDLWTLLESPPRILELEDVIPIFESSGTSLKWLLMLSWLPDAPDIREFDLGESSCSIIQDQEELFLGRCYRGHSLHFLCTGHRCYEILAWSLGWQSYIIPFNQVSNSQQM